MRRALCHAQACINKQRPFDFIHQSPYSLSLILNCAIVSSLSAHEHPRGLLFYSGHSNAYLPDRLALLIKSSRSGSQLGCVKVLYFYSLKQMKGRGVEYRTAPTSPSKADMQDALRGLKGLTRFVDTPSKSAASFQCPKELYAGMLYR